jgi:O-succinylbenzoate synthase
VVLAEIHSEGLIGWGECTAGEHPHFSEESVDSCWQVITDELGPMLAAQHAGEWRGVSADLRLVRGNRMAKATLENAIWDLEAQRKGISLSQLLGGVREIIPCGVSIGIQSSIPS